MNMDAFNTLQPCNRFVPLINTDSLKFIHDSHGVKAEELQLGVSSMALEKIETNVRIKFEEQEEAQETWEKQRALSKFFYQNLKFRNQE